VLATGSAGAAIVAVWAFVQDGLTTDRADLGLRASAGHELGIAIVAMVLLLGAAGLGIGFATARRKRSAAARRQAGTAILIGLALIPLVVAGALALSERGLTGSLSHGWTQLTDPHASTPPNEPGRLTAVGSVRARYWNQALRIFQARPLLGAGAGGYATTRPKFREDTLDVRHAHGYVVQTLADLGIVGLLVSLALLAAWLAAAGRAAGLDPRGATAGAPFSAERIGLLTLLSIVVVFGVHSFVDWTWFIPGNAVIALLCAGWVAGRGPVAGLPGGSGIMAAAHGAGARLRGGPRLGGAAAIGVVVIAVSWATYQPLRSVHAGEDALSALESGNVDGARRAALHARDINPLSIEPLFDLAVIETAAKRPEAARAALEDAALLQPSNADPWLHLAEFDLAAGLPRAAIADLGPALSLDPRSPVGIRTFLEASREITTPATPRRRTATP
jgi:O-antigen ligase